MSTDGKRHTMTAQTVTVYIKGTLEEFYIIAKAIKELVKTYRINGILSRLKVGRTATRISP
jgi:hypothetical protein